MKGAKKSKFPSQLVFFVGVIIIMGAFILTAQLNQSISGGAIISVPGDKNAAQKLANVPTVSVGKMTEEIGIGAGIVDNNQPAGSFNNPLESDDISLLQEASLAYNAGSGYDDYAVHDELWFGANSPSIQSSLSEDSVDADYGDKIALEVDANSIYYYYVFDDAIDVDAVSQEDPLEIKFLGKDMRITGATASRITVNTGEAYYMSIGDTISANGHTIKLEDVGDGKAAVSVDGGQVVTIDEEDTESWAEGVQVTVDSIFYKSGDPDKSTANLRMGQDASNSYDDGDEFVGEVEGSGYWEWVIDNLDQNAATDITAAGTATGPIIAIRNTFSADSASDDDPAPVTNQGCYDIPKANPYLQLCIDDLTVSSNDYMTLEVAVEDLTLNDAGGNFANAGNQQVLAIKANKNDGLIINSGALQGTAGYLTNDAETDTIYLFLNGTDGAGNVVIDVFYEDENQLTIAGNVTSNPAVNEEIGNVNYGKTKGNVLPINFQLDVDSFYLNLTAADVEIAGALDNTGIQVQNGTAFNGFGRIDHVNDVHDINIATQDEDLRTDYGLIIKDPENGINDDNIEFSIPDDAARAKVTVKSYTMSAEDQAEAKKVLDLSSVDSVSEGSILVGGPAVNELTAKAMGKPFPTYGSQLEWKEGWCYIKGHTLNGKTVIVIAGYEAADTSACVDKYISGVRNYNNVI